MKGLCTHFPRILSLILPNYPWIVNRFHALAPIAGGIDEPLGQCHTRIGQLLQFIGHTHKLSPAAFLCINQPYFMANESKKRELFKKY